MSSINEILINEYLKDPCRVSSIPYWKAKSIPIPDGMRIIHDEDYSEQKFIQYADQLYFRLIHDLHDIEKPILPNGFSLCKITLKEFSKHINLCYGADCLTEGDLQEYTERRVYDQSLWLAVREDSSKNIVATGIGELDGETGEGILEWIQVSKDCRRLGLGSYIVLELLRRMVGRADFATVSGQCDNPTAPEALYRKCGFRGSDVWHILKRKN